MADFKCTNNECRNNNVLIHISHATYRMRGMDLLADERFCTICNMEMQEIKEPYQAGNAANIISFNPVPNRPIY